MLGLFLIYYISSITEPTNVQIDSIKPDLVGHFISTDGAIVSRTKTKAGHLFLTLQNGDGNISIVMFSTFLNKEKVNPDKLLKGVKLSVQGVLEEYKGELQIIPKKGSDVKILR